MASAPPLAPIDHGTVRGFRQHKRRGVPVCEPCMDALREDNERKEAERLADPATRFASPEQAAWYGGQFQDKQDAAQAAAARRPRAPAGPPPLPPAGDPGWGVPVYGKDLVVGDTIVHLHRDFETHVLDRFEPYRGELAGVLGDKARTAYAGSWGIAVGQHSIVRILPRGGGR